MKSYLMHFLSLEGVWDSDTDNIEYVEVKY